MIFVAVNSLVVMKMFILWRGTVYSEEPSTENLVYLLLAIGAALGLLGSFAYRYRNYE
jgi:hypothetical protein